MMGLFLRALGTCAAGVAAALACLVLARRLIALRRGGRNVGADEMLADPVFSFVLLAGAGCVASAAVSLALLPVCLVVAWVLSRKLPGIVEERKRRDLRSACDGQLDVLADIVAMGVRAGLSFDAALDIYCEKFTGELAHEMYAARLSWKNGVVSRERALRDLAERIGSAALRRFSETVTQAIRYGSPLAEMLSTFAEELRQERFESIERQVAKAPVKMLVPTAVCILPAMLILIMGPVALQFFGAGI